MEAPILDVGNVGIRSIAIDTAAEIEGFKNHVDKMFGKVDKVGIYLITNNYVKIIICPKSISRWEDVDLFI